LLALPLFVVIILGESRA